VKKIMVVAPGPAYSVADVYDGLVKGLRAQPDVEVATINLDARVAFFCNAHMETPDGEFVPAFSHDDGLHMAARTVEQHLYEYWPDIVVFVSGFFIPPEMWGILARRPHHVVLWCTESPYEDDKQAQPPATSTRSC
jgi:hypothetical protein